MMMVVSKNSVTMFLLFLVGSNFFLTAYGFVVPSSSTIVPSPGGGGSMTTKSRNQNMNPKILVDPVATTNPSSSFSFSNKNKKKKFILHSQLVPPLQHMGHSHSHHHHHDDHSKTTLTPTKQRQRMRRRIALWLFCALATCGPPLLKRRSLQSQDILAFVVSSLAISSSEKIRRTIVGYIEKFKGFRDGIIKHSGGGGESSSASSRLYQKQLRSSSSYQDTTAADRVTWIGVVVNLLLSGGKLFVGIFAHSSALIADAGHSLSDLFSDFITLWSVRVARLPPDEDHPYGHSKFEALGSLFLSFTLLATGVGVGVMANKELIQLLGSSSSSNAAAKAAVQLPGPLALVMAGISIASKEWLYRITKVVGERLNSPVVIANAWHHRSDAYSSILALLSIAWAMTGFAAADAAAGMLVAGMICMTGADILVESVQQLSDSADMELQGRVSELVDSHVARDDDVLESTSVRARQVGSSAIVDVTVETSPQLSTTAARAVERRLKNSLKQQFKTSGRFLQTATVHAKPKLLSCPLLQEQQNQDESNDDDHKFLSASSVENLVRQRALLMEAATTQQQQQQQQHQPHDGDDEDEDELFTTTTIKDVTVHYSQQHQTFVDVKITSDSQSLEELQLYAQDLKSNLEDLPEIVKANVYLDLDASTTPTTSNNNLGGNNGDEKVKVLPTNNAAADVLSARSSNSTTATASRTSTAIDLAP